MAIPGINFFNGDENNVKPNNSAAPQFMNTIFGAEPTGGAGMDAFVATESAETATEVDASEAAEPADPSEAPKKSTKKHSNKADANYKKVYDVALNQAICRIKTKKGGFAKKIEDIPPTERQKYIDLADRVTKMTIKLCKKYEIESLAPLIADMMGYETGGYKFTQYVLSEKNKTHKGAMQVDFETCQCIFSEGPKKNKDWHDKHFTQDDKRIAVLKSKYKTARKLYQAIQKDVELGLEVGIIAYKAKLSVAKGNVHKAVGLYCGNDYKCNIKGLPQIYRT